MNTLAAVTSFQAAAVTAGTGSPRSMRWASGSTS